MKSGLLLVTKAIHPGQLIIYASLATYLCTERNVPTAPTPLISAIFTSRRQNKKLTLAAAGVPSLVAAPVMAQSTVNLYGLIDAAVVYQNKLATGTRTGIDAGQSATSRRGMRGNKDLGRGMKAFFNIESKLINDSGAAGLGFGGGTAGGTTQSLFDRAAIVGLPGGFGSVSLGRQNILGVDSIGQGDPIGLAHPATNPNVAFSALNAGAIYQSFGTHGGGAALRQNNSIRYLTPVFSGFGGALMYGAGAYANYQRLGALEQGAQAANPCGHAVSESR